MTDQDQAPGGLTSAQAASRLQSDGPNRLPRQTRRSWGRMAWELMHEPTFGLLLAAALLYLLLGDWHESLSLLVMVLVVLGLTLYQEGRTEHALDALADLASPRATVWRDGQAQVLPATEVVVGDMLRIKEGDRIAADGCLRGVGLVGVDESMLSGESVPVTRLGEQAVYAGTLVVQGAAWLEVQATGAHTRMGQIGLALKNLQAQDSPLRAQTRVLVRRMATLGLVASVMLIAVQGWREGDWLRATLSGIALAMAMMPEEFAVVLAVLPAMGAWRLSRQQVLTRRLRAIETLGAVSVLCVDKTGTLTDNRMRVAALQAGDQIERTSPQTTRLPASLRTLLEYAILASETVPFDPMERACHTLGAQCLQDTGQLHRDWVMVQRYELSPELRAMSRVWLSPVGPAHVVATKGSPEAVMDLCHLSTQERDAQHQAVQAMADQGLRVLGVAKARHNGPPWPALAHDFEFAWVGLIGLQDPLRADVPAAVAQCRQAGVRVLMITGDYPGTARAIAREAGLDLGPSSAWPVISGDEMDSWSDAQLQSRLRQASVCARISPAQKLRIVQALAAAGEVVAMTGDGVNDAPALKAAHVGVAMGERGTDVAREAASVVLVNDQFSSLVSAVRMGRRIFDNLRKSMAFIVAVHVPVAGAALLPPLLGWPPVLWPLHIVLLELLIDPSCSLVFEQERSAPDLMQRPPRDPNAPLLDGAALRRSVLQGLVALGGVIAVVAVARGLGHEAVAATWGFMALVLGNLGLIVVNLGPGRRCGSCPQGAWHSRAWHLGVLQNHALLWVLGLTLLMLVVCVSVQPLAQGLHLVPWQQWS